jgi:hypothetical protein
MVMKNIQIIDGAENCVYDIFSATNEEFNLLFSFGTDVAFINEIYNRENHKALDDCFGNIWSRRIEKKNALGIHGTIFYDLDNKIKYYPSRRDESAINPDGTPLR